MSETEQEVTPPEPDEPDEAAQDEEDEANEEGTPAPEPDEPEQGEPAASSDEERVEAFKKIDRSFGTYKAAVERNLEDEVLDWLMCPMCAPSAVPGFVNKHDMGRVPEEVAANVKMFLGLAREKDYPASDTHTMCGVCQGLGKVSTGSRVPDHATITCHACKGYGYTPPPSPSASPGGFNGGSVERHDIPAEDLPQPDRDNWGEPRVLPDGSLNENYGKQPQFKSQHPVYGVTANLTAEELISG